MIPVMICYVVAVTLGFLHGLFRNGNMTIALWEVRTQFHLLLVYILAVNLLTERRHVTPMLWITILCSTLQSALAVVKYVTLSGNVPDAGLMIHDVAFTFNVGFFLCLLSIIIPFDKRLTATSYVALPIIVAGILFNQRRGAIGAIVAAFIPLIPLLLHLFPDRRVRVQSFAVVVTVFSAIYFPIAWNASGPWALPARALRSQTDPNNRDATSNNYRYAEDTDLKFTRDLQPWTGIGYGRPFSQVVPLPLIDFPMKDYLPHNGILWVWMRIGHLGFLAFLMMLFTVIIKGIQIMKGVKDSGLKVVGTLAVLNMAMLYVYSKYDMQLISSRTVFTCFALVGTVAAISRFTTNAESSEDTQPKLEGALTGV